MDAKGLSHKIVQKIPDLSQRNGHVVDLYGALPVSHTFEVVPGLGHEGPRILRSPAGLRWIFDVRKAAR